MSKLASMHGEKHDMTLMYEPESFVTVGILLVTTLLLMSSQHAGWLAMGLCSGRMQADLQLCCAHAALDIFRQAPALPSEGFDALQPHLTASTRLTCHRLTSAVALYHLRDL